MASLARTILEEHLERGELVPGHEIALRVDQALAQDATGTMAMMQFELFGEERVRLDTAVVYVDHNFLENELARPWIQAKDVILELLRRRGVRGGRGCVFEFTGPGVHTLSYTERGTIANMIAELGATGAVFPADDETRAWLEEQERLEDFTELPTGDTGDFDDEEHIDLAELVPLVEVAG